MGTVDLLRLETVHAVMVHFTVGVVPMLIVAYGIAALRRSPRWTFAADAVLTLTALITLGTLASGLLSNALLAWPGGLERWRALHLGLGIATTTLLIAFAAFRLVASRRRPHAGAVSVASAIVIASFIVATGWVGGEVLVFHSGMAVKAAGDGIFAPPAEPRGVRPETLDESMGRVRAEWAVIATSLGLMMAERPSRERYDDVAEAARHLGQHATWLQEIGSKEVEARGQPPAQLRFMAGLLKERATAVEDAAKAKELSDLSRAVGELGTSCIGCHETFRW